MEIKKCATAGTMESSDVIVEVAPSDSGLEIEVSSIVMNQFGDAIKATVEGVAKEYGVDRASITVNDRGAVDWTIRARVETALKRAGGVNA